MPVMGTVAVGDKVDIDFSAHGTNKGVSLVNAFYIAKPDAPAAPVVPPIIVVAPGAAQHQRTTVGDSFSLIIDLDVPPAGDGLLEVRVNGVVRDRDTIRFDQDWIYLIVGTD